MNSLRQAAQQALSKLEKLRVTIDSEWGDCRDLDEIEIAGDQWEEVISLRAALAEPDWQDLYLKEKKRADMWRDKYESVAGAEQRIHPLTEPVQEPITHLFGTLPVHDAPPKAEPVQEPVAWMDIADDGTRLAVRMYSDGSSEEVPLYLGCDYCNHPLYAAIKCKNCGRVAE